MNCGCTKDSYGNKLPLHIAENTLFCGIAKLKCGNLFADDS